MKMNAMFIVIPLLIKLVFSGYADESYSPRTSLEWKAYFKAKEEEIERDRRDGGPVMRRIRELSAENTEANRGLLYELLKSFPQAEPSTASGQPTKVAAFNALAQMSPPFIAKRLALATLATEIGALHSARWISDDFWYPNDLIFATVDFLAQSPTDPEIIEALTRYARDNWIKESIREHILKHNGNGTAFEYALPVDGQETNKSQKATVETVQPSAVIEDTEPRNVPATSERHTDELIETKNTPWAMPLLIGFVAIGGTVAIWRWFRRNQNGETT